MPGPDEQRRLFDAVTQWQTRLSITVFTETVSPLALDHQNAAGLFVRRVELPVKYPQLVRILDQVRQFREDTASGGARNPELFRSVGKSPGIS